MNLPAVESSAVDKGLPFEKPLRLYARVSLRTVNFMNNTVLPNMIETLIMTID